MDIPLRFTFILLIMFHIKHFVADFPLQREYMLRKTSPNWDFLVPLSIHCGVHGFFTFLICLVVAPALWWLALVDFVTHFLMDRIKSGPRYLGRYNDLSKASYWNCLGFDQTVHHLTHLGLVYVIVVFG